MSPFSFFFVRIDPRWRRSFESHSSVIVRPLPSPTDAPRSLEFASRRKFIQKKEHAFRNRCEIVDVRSSLPRVSPNKSIPLSGRKQIKKKREKGRERKKNSQWNTNEKRKKGDKNSAVLGQTETLCGNHRGEWPWQRKKKREREKEREKKTREARLQNQGKSRRERRIEARKATLEEDTDPDTRIHEEGRV